MSVDIDQLAAIDVHVHAERNEDEPQDPVPVEVLEAAAQYFGGSPPQPTAREVADCYTNSQLKHRMLFGSDYLLITPGRWLSDFERLLIKDEVGPLALKMNAARLLGLRE